MGGAGLEAQEDGRSDLVGGAFIHLYPEGAHHIESHFQKWRSRGDPELRKLRHLLFQWALENPLARHAFVGVGPYLS